MQCNNINKYISRESTPFYRKLERSIYSTMKLLKSFSGLQLRLKNINPLLYPKLL